MTTNGTHSDPPRRIGLFTSGRQDTGYLLPVARAVATHPALAPTVFVSGTHLLASRGDTGQAFADAGLARVEVPMILDDEWDVWDGQIGPSELAVLAENLALTLSAHPVEVMVLLGDRIETLLAAVVCVSAGLFVAQVHAGDRAPGDFDDANRHAIAKLAHVHFAATDSAGERLVRMGESPGRVHVVGSPGIDSILTDGLADPAVARQSVGLGPDVPFVVLLHHPSGQDEHAERAAIEAICQAVADQGLMAVCLEPNADPGRRVIQAVLQDFSCRCNWPILPTVERRAFLRLIQLAVALVGNSSSGMIESAAVGAAVLDVGPRQQGREHSDNVVHVAPERAAIGQWLARLRDDADLAGRLRSARCVFGDGQACRRIAQALADMELTSARRVKLNEY